MYNVVMAYCDVPDIVAPELLITPDEVMGWRPVLVPDRYGSRERVHQGLITPAEMALQLAFGHNVHGVPIVNDRSYDELFADEAHTATDNIKGFTKHEAGYVLALAMWHERDVIVDYPGSFINYAAFYDGYKRALQMTTPHDLQQELYDRLESEYVVAVNTGCKSRNDLSLLKVKVTIKELRELGDEHGASLLEEVYFS